MPRHWYEIDVPEDATLYVNGTVTIGAEDTTGGWQSIMHVEPAGSDLVGSFNGSAGTFEFEQKSWTNGGGDAYPRTIEVFQEYGRQIAYDLVLRVSAPGGSCASYGGKILGGCNPAETYSCNGDRQVGKPVSVQSGNFWHRFDDFAFAGRGPGLGLARTYNSAASAVDGPFGYGWQSSANVKLVENPSSSPPNQVTITHETGSASTFTPTTGGNYTAPSYTDAVLTKQTGVGWTFVRRANTMMQFNTAGRLLSISDPNDEAITFAYNGSGQLSTMTDDAGRTLTFDYQGGPWVRFVRDNSSPQREVEYSYNTAGEMEWFEDVELSKTSFTYDVAHRMLTMRDPRSNAGETPTDVVNTYDSVGRVDTQTDRNGAVTDFDYTEFPSSDPNNHEVSWTDVTSPPDSDHPQGIKTRYGFGNGLLQFETHGYGTAKAATTRYEYDPVTLGVEKVIDPRVAIRS